MNTQEQRKLSESLLAACKAAGIEEPRYIAQGASCAVYHCESKPNQVNGKITFVVKYDGGAITRIDHPPYADDWQDSLLEFREYALIRTCDKCQAVTAIDMIGSDANEKELQCEGETVYRVSKEAAHGSVIKLCLARHPEHIADTSKMIDACDIAYQKMNDEYAGRRTFEMVYRRAWSDALAWWDGNHIADDSKMIDPYKVQVGGVTLDPYMIANIYGINDPIIFQMLKKLLRFGRKHKDASQDVIDTITSAIRWLEINAPENAKSLIEAMTEKGEGA